MSTITAAATAHGAVSVNSARIENGERRFLFPLYINLIVSEGEKILGGTLIYWPDKIIRQMFCLFTGDRSNLYAILHVLMISQA